MITLTEKIALLEFGTGDILVGYGKSGGTPTLTFSNTEKKKWAQHLMTEPITYLI